MLSEKDKNHKYLFDFKENKINKCDIFIGKVLLRSKQFSRFDTSIEKIIYTKLLDKYIGKKYRSYNQKIYQDNNNFLEINGTKKKHNMRKNMNNKLIDNYLYLSYFDQEKNIQDFSCKKNYNIINNNVIEFFINDELSILFLQNNNSYSIKLRMCLNHNIDRTLELLNDNIKLVDSVLVT